MSEIWDFLKKLIERVPLVFLVLGVALIVVAATNGRLSAYLVVNSQAWQIFLASLGLILIGVAIYLTVREEGIPSVDCSLYGISIDFPQNIKEYSPPIPIGGNCKELPKGLELWVFSISGSGSGARYWPQNAADSAQIKERGKWDIMASPGQVWKSGDHRKYGVFLVGPNGQALIQLFKAAGQELSAYGNKPWPGISKFTNDIVQCGTAVEIVLK